MVVLSVQTGFPSLPNTVYSYHRQHAILFSVSVCMFPGTSVCVCVCGGGGLPVASDRKWIIAASAHNNNNISACVIVSMMNVTT